MTNHVELPGGEERIRANLRTLSRALEETVVWLEMPETVAILAALEKNKAPSTTQEAEVVAVMAKFGRLIVRQRELSRRLVASARMVAGRPLRMRTDPQG